MGRTPECGNYATDQIAQGMFALLKAARMYDPSANFSLRSVTMLSEDLVTNATKAQLELGCDPAANAYGEPPLSVDNPESLPFRFAGGHVHLGLIFPDNGTIAAPRKFNKKYTTTKELEKLVHTLDATVGVLFVAVMADLDSPIRRQYYGRAGEYRQKPYGLEYRVLSNAWLLHPVLTQFMFDMTRAGLAIFDNDIPIPSPLSSDRIRHIINTCDVEAAREYIFDNWRMWKCIAQKYYGLGVEDAFKLLVEEGAAALLPVNSGIKVRSNWHITQTSPSMLSLQWGTHASSSNVRMGDFLSKLRTMRSLAAIK
jgi:hypothetical protein